tara:strand:+ start:114 stop:617 length:504 start_codon:yes stop_codon:yes gene_type:complete
MSDYRLLVENWRNYVAENQNGGEETLEEGFLRDIALALTLLGSAGAAQAGTSIGGQELSPTTVKQMVGSMVDSAKDLNPRTHFDLKHELLSLARQLKDLQATDEIEALDNPHFTAAYAKVKTLLDMAGEELEKGKEGADQKLVRHHLDLLQKWKDIGEKAKISRGGV